MIKFTIFIISSALFSPGMMPTFTVPINNLDEN